MVYLGLRALVGVWLGALLLNLYAAGGQWYLYPFLVASAATAQAALGGWVASKIRNQDVSLNHPLKVLGYLVVAGPLTCCLSATLSVAAMSEFGPLKGQDFRDNWFHWWMGDVLGVLAFAPLGEVARLLQPGRRLKLFFLYSWPSMATLALAALLFWQSQNSDQDRLQQRFHHDVTVWGQLIEQDLTQISSELRSLQLLVTRHPEWVDLQSSGNPQPQAILDQMLHHVHMGPGRLSSLALVALVSDAQRADFERSLSGRYGRPMVIMDGTSSGNLMVAPRHDGCRPTRPSGSA